MNEDAKGFLSGCFGVCMVIAFVGFLVFGIGSCELKKDRIKANARIEIAKTLAAKVELKLNSEDLKDIFK